MNEQKSSFWQRHLNEASTSGLSSLAYCKIHSLAPVSFYYWAKKLRKPAPSVKIENPFVQVMPQSPSPKLDPIWLGKLLKELLR